MRIRKVYRREFTETYPPVEVVDFSLCHDKEEFYVTTLRMAPYKTVGMTVEAFRAMPDKRLVVISL